MCFKNFLKPFLKENLQKTTKGIQNNKKNTLYHGFLEMKRKQNFFASIKKDNNFIE
jgi:hypothetical protein